MEIRQAILKAADHVQGHHGLYQFSPNVRPDCGTPGCMLGWTGFFLGIKADSCFTDRVAKALGHDHLGLALHALQTCGPFHLYAKASVDNDADAAASVLRSYADKYHPASVKLPDWEAMAKPAGVTKLAAVRT